MRAAEIDRLSLAEVKQRKSFCILQKQKLIDYLQSLKNKFLDKKLTYEEYEKITNTPYEGKTVSQWFEYYDEYVKDCEAKINGLERSLISKKAFSIFLLSAALITIGFAVFYSSPAIIGFFLQGEEEFVQNIGMNFTESTSYELVLENQGLLDSLKLSGLIEGSGEVKVYLGDKLVLDSSTIAVEAVSGENMAGKESPIIGRAIEGKEEMSIPESPTESEETANEETMETPAVEEPAEEEPIIEENASEEEIPETSEIAIKPFRFVCEDTCSLEEFGLNQTSYTLRIEISDARLELESVTYTLKEIVKEEVSVPESNETVLEENATNISTNISNISSVSLVQGRAEIGKPVKWTKRIVLEELASNLSVELPLEIEDVNVYKVENESKTEINEEKVKVDGASLSTVKKGGFSAMSGNKKTKEKENFTEVIIEDEVQEVEIEYYTQAPTAIEENLSNGKKIVVSGPDELNYTNILAYTEIPEIARVGQERLIKVFWKENESIVAFNASDSDGNGMLDYVEWNVLHLSNQTFEIIIEISRAEHLDENRSFVEDVYNETYARDNVWKEIPAGHYVSVVFNENISSGNDITIYARSSSNGIVEVYEKDSDILIASFGIIGGEDWYNVSLENLQASQDSFDLKVVNGNVEFDYIVDPVGPKIPWWVESGETTLAAATTTSVDLTRPVNISKAFILFSRRAVAAQDEPSDSGAYAQWVNSTRFNLIKSSTEAGAIYSWQVIEGNNIRVQNGTTAYAAGQVSFNIPISSVNTSRTVAFMTFGSCGSTTVGDNNEIFWTGNITNSTNLNIARGDGSACAGSVGYFVVEFNDNSTIQKGQITNVGNTTNPSYAVVNAIDLSNTWLYFSMNFDGTATGLDDTGVRGMHYNTTAFAFSRRVAGGTAFVQWHAISTPGASVQNGTASYAATVTESNITVSSVATNRSFSLHSFDSSGAGTTFTNTLFTGRLTNSTNLLVVRGGTAQSSDVSWQVIQFSNVYNDYAPVVILDYPPANYVNLTSQYVNLTFNATATDDFGLLNCSLWHNATGTWHMNQSQAKTGTINVTSFNLTGLTNKTFIWNIKCFDDANNASFASANRSVILNWLPENSLPTHTTPLLTSTYLTDYTFENLTCYNQSTADANGDSVKNIFGWKRNGSSIMVLNIPFEGGSNSTFTKDYSGSGNNGSVVNATWNSTGGFDGKGAYKFNGTASTYINLADSPSLSFTSPGITITAWVYLNEDQAGERGIVRKDDQWQLGIFPATNTIRNIIGTSGTTGWTTANDEAYTINANTWYFFAFTYNGSALKHYANGQQIGADKTVTGNIVDNANPVRISAIGDGTSSAGPINGTIDDVKIYNYSLTSQQIQALYNNGTNLIVADETEIGENWTCSVTPNDGYGDGITLDSNNLSIKEYNSPPSVIVYWPQGGIYDENSFVIITINTSDNDGIDTSIAQVTMPNGTKENITLSHGLEGDNFNSDTLGTIWGPNIVTGPSQTCIADINTTQQGKLYLSVSGDATPYLNTICGIVSSKRIDGDFDLNLSFNMTSQLLLGTTPMLILAEGNTVQNTGYYISFSISNTTGYQILMNAENFTNFILQRPTSDTYGKLRIKRIGNNFTFYTLNNTNNSWFQENITQSEFSMPRALYTSIMTTSQAPNYNPLNVTWDDLEIWSNNFTFGEYTNTPINGTYTVNILVNDTLGAINNTETTNFNISFMNDAPSLPYILYPFLNQQIGGIINILWLPVTDEENDAAQFNITLLNPNGSINATIISNYGNLSSTSYLWNTESYQDGNYAMEITVFENETAERYSKSSVLTNFSIQFNPKPRVIINYPQPDTLRQRNDYIAIQANISDSDGLNITKAQITLPNSTLVNVSLTQSPQKDSFNFNTVGIVWKVENSSIGTGQNCTANIDTTATDKAFTSISGDGSPNTDTYCSLVMTEQVIGDFDVNVSFNITSEQGTDYAMLLKMTEVPSSVNATKNLFLSIGNWTGYGRTYDVFVNDGNISEYLIERETSDSYGKFRIKRQGNNFTFYTWNNTNNSWTYEAESGINIHPGLFIALESETAETGWGNISVEWDNLETGLSPLFYVGSFKDTVLEGNYNLTIIAQDNLGALNNSEKTNFTITEQNDAPSTPFILFPSPDAVLHNTQAIIWSQVTDPEGDSLQFNITLLNPDLSFNASIVSGYGTSSTTSYSWNSSSYTDGLYSMKITVFENETAEMYFTTYTLSGNFTLHNTAPDIEFVSPTPANGSEVFGIVTINASSIHEDLNYISIYNSTSEVAYCTESVCTFLWNTSQYPDGSMVFYALAEDDIGKTNRTENRTFIVKNSIPTLASLLLNATSYNNYTTDNLTCNYNLNGSATTVAVSWLKNNNPIMVLYLPFEGNSSNALLDYSGNANNALLFNDPYWTATGGRDGKGAFALNGTSASEEYLMVENSSSLGYIGQRGTISIWIKPLNASNGNQQAIIKDNITDATTYASGIDLSITSTGQVIFYPKLNPTLWNNRIISSSSLANNEWSHVVVTWDYSIKNASMYIDGIEPSYSMHAVNPVNWVAPAAVRKLLIGKDPDLTTRDFNGTIDEARIYNSVLSKEQIQALYNNGTNLIVAEETMIEENWTCKVTPFNSLQAGATYASDNITIRPTPVPIVTLDYPPASYSNLISQHVNLTFNASAISEDLTNCSLWHNISGTWARNQTQVVTGILNNTQFNLTGLTNISFIWNIECYSIQNMAGRGSSNRSVTLSWQEIPTIINLRLNATSVNNYTNDNLTCNYDLNGTAETSVVSWIKNQQPLMALNMPFEGNSSNALVDYSGNGNNGLFTTAVWNSTAGRAGNGAFVFDSSLSQYILTGASDSLNFSKSCEFTETAWIKPNHNDTGYHGFLGKESLVSTNFRAPSIWVYQSTALHAGFGNGTSWNSFITGTGIINNDAWNFVAVRFNRTNYIVDVNGVNVYSQTGSWTNQCPNGALNSIDIGRADNYFNGSIDDVRIYNYSLPDAQVAALYNNGTNLIVSQELVEGDNWTCQATPFTSLQAGLTYTSNNLIARPANEISSCTQITSPGVYNLVQNISGSNACINIQTENVTIDCQGYKISGIEPVDSGVSAIERTNITVKNCFIEGFTNGIYFESTTNSLALNNTLYNDIQGILFLTADNNQMINNTVINNSNQGLHPMASNNVNITGNVISSTYYGIILEFNNYASNNIIDGSFQGIVLTGSQNSFVINNTVTNSLSAGIEFDSLSANNVVANNTLINNSRGILMIDAVGNNITGNRITLNNNSGIYFSGANENNSIYNNFFNNSLNYYFDASNPVNYWNITKIFLDNIIGGNQTGGNFWASPNGTGFSENRILCMAGDDGFCTNDYNLSGNNTDYLPLTYLTKEWGPQIIFVSSISNTDLNESSYKPIYLNLTVYDANGFADINMSGVQANFTRLGINRTSDSCWNTANYSSSYANFSCSVNMWYFDSAGIWNVSASVKDIIDLSASNSSTYFQINQLTAIVISPNALTWNIASGSFNQTATNHPTIVNNTGNANLTIEMNSTNLYGNIDDTKAIYAGNFSVGIVSGGNPPAECSGTGMIGGSFVNITGSLVNPGNLSIGGGIGQEELYYCIKEVGAIQTQIYSTNKSGSWTIRIIALFVAVSLRKRKKDKVIIGELSVPATLFTENLGTLEALAKYMKENLQLDYSEIAKLLNRDDRTIWTAYNKALEKQKKMIEIKRTLAYIPIEVFQNRKLSVFESAILYMKDKGMKYSEIAKMLGREQRNIWTIYSRAVKKMKA